MVPSASIVSSSVADRFARRHDNHTSAQTMPLPRTRRLSGLVQSDHRAFGCSMATEFEKT
jgi:hypothetical protein